MLAAIRQWVIRTMMKNNTGVVQTLPKNDLIELNTQITAQRLMQNGVDPETLKNADQVENIVNQIEKSKVNVNPGMTSVKKADVFDIEGNKIDTSKGIIGGKEMKSIKQGDPITSENFGSSQFAPDNQYGFGRKRESDAAIKARLDANNKKGIGRLETDNFALNTITKIKSMKPMDAMKEANLVAGKEGRYANLNDNQVKKIIDDTTDHIFERDIPIDPEDFATGGRAGFDNGGAPSIVLNPKDEPMGPGFETNDPEEAAKEIIKRLIKVDGAQIPLTEEGLLSLNINNLDEQSIGGIIKLLGGDLQFGAGRSKDDAGIGFNFKKRFADGGRIGFGKGDIVTKGIPALIKAGQGKFTKAQYLIERIKNTIKGNPDDKYVQETFPNFIKELEANPDLAKNENVFKELGGDLPEGQKIVVYGDDTLDFFTESSGSQNIKKIDSFMEKHGLSRDKALEIMKMEPDDQVMELTKRKFIKQKRTDNADGGRIGLKAGMTKRAFLKLMGGVGAGIGAAKSGILSGLGKGAGKQVAKEVVQQTTSSTPPPYFFKLVEKIKTLGDDTMATQDKAIAKKYKDYTMEEDFAGNITIIKKGDDNLMMRDGDVYMSYKVDEVPVKGKKGSTKVEEYEEFTARPDGDGKMKDIEPGVPDEVVQEGTMFEDNMTEFGKASGGIARMLGE